MPEASGATATRIWVTMPALNEEDSIGRVIDALPGADELGMPLTVVVCDNGSTDGTADVATARGAVVVRDEVPGYGQACLTALAEIARREPDAQDLIVFLDADFSDDPTELPLVVAPLVEGRADLVIGSRVLGEREPGALLPQARFGNWLAGHLIHWITGVHFTDLGPFRALRWGTLEALPMTDRAFGWTVQMQLEAAAAGLRCTEVPVSYRKRVGKSKITGTLRGTVLASSTILSILGRWGWRRAMRGRPTAARA